jgi:hypothetical protein
MRICIDQPGDNVKLAVRCGRDTVSEPGLEQVVALMPVDVPDVILNIATVGRQNQPRRIVQSITLRPTQPGPELIPGQRSVVEDKVYDSSGARTVRY